MSNGCSLRIMLQELLLIQALTKRDIARTVRMSIKKINKVLESKENEYKIRQEQEQRLASLYTRLKLYEKNIEEYLVGKPKFKE